MNEPVIRDKLDEIIYMQQKLMERLGVVAFDKGFRDDRQIMVEMEHSPKSLTIQEQTKNMLHAITCEIGEISDEINWKPWKSERKDVDLDLLYSELIDVVHFIIEICIMWGMDADKIYEYYVAKNQINHERQDQGY